MDNNYVLSALLLFTMVMIRHYNKIVIAGNKGTLFHGIENQMRVPFIIGFIVLIQALLGSYKFKLPSRVQKYVEHPIARTIFMWLILYSGTQDIELSTVLLSAFLVTMQLLRTEKERKEHPYLI